MSAQTGSTIHMLSGDFVPVISDPSLSVFIGKIVAVRSTSTIEQDLKMNVGSLTIEVLENIAGQSPRPGTTVDLPFHQVDDPLVRIRNGRDQWNNLELSQNRLLLLACRMVGGEWQAIAGKNVDSASSPDALGLQQAYRIERVAGDPQQKHRLLQDGLTSPNILLLSYVLDALTERKVIGRHDAVEMMVSAMNSGSTPPDNKREIGYEITRYLFTGSHESQQDDAIIIGGVATALVNETDGQRQLDWANMLRSCVLGMQLENGTADVKSQISLLQAVRNGPPPNEVERALSAAERSAKDDPGEKAALARLRYIWQTAFSK